MNLKLNKKNFALHFFMVLFISGCAGTMQIQSIYNPSPIVIDGNLNDWKKLNTLTGSDIAFGFINDKENVYMSFTTTDKNKMMKILTMGLTVWLESDNPKSRIGIKFPMTIQDEGMDEFIPMQMERNPKVTPDARIKKLISEKDLLQVINKDDLPIYTDQPDKGEKFNAKLGLDSTHFVYELRISLKDNDIAQRVFGNNVDEYEVSFMTNKTERKMMRSSGGMRQGGDGGPMGGEGNGSIPRRGGKSGGKFPGMRPDREPIEYNFKVKLGKE